MTSARTPSGGPDIGSLVASERIIAPQPSEVRHRAFARARMAMATSGDAAPHFRRVPQLGGFRWLVAAAVVLGMVSLAAAAALEIRRRIGAQREEARRAEVARTGERRSGKDRG